MIEILLDLLSSSYSNQWKKDILSELASVIGQLCNDEETRSSICENHATIPCLLFIFDSADKASKLKSKVMFALKQLCVNSIENKQRVGEHVIKHVMDELSPLVEEKHRHELNLDCATNAILLLLLLAIHNGNRKIMQDINVLDLIPKLLMDTKLGTIELTRERLNQLSARIEEFDDEQ